MSDNRARIWFSLFVLAVFCVGAAAGLMIGWHMPPPGHPGIFEMMHGPTLPPPEVLNKIEDDLQLDATQRAQVQKIFDAHRDRLEQVHRDAQQRFNQEARSLHAEVRALLRPDQQQRFDRFLEQHHIQ